MKIRMLTDIAGTFHNDPEGVKRGDEVDVDEASALRYIANGYAEAVSKRDARKADKAATEYDDTVAEAAEAGGLEVVTPDAVDSVRAVDARALDPEAVIHDETPAYDPTVPPIPLDEPEDEDVSFESGERDEPDQRDEPRLVAQEDNPKPVKNALAEPLDDPEFVDDEAAKGVITDPAEVDEVWEEADAEPAPAEDVPAKSTSKSRRNRRR